MKQALDSNTYKCGIRGKACLLKGRNLGSQTVGVSKISGCMDKTTSKSKTIFK